MQENLTQQIKTLIIDTLNLEGMQADDIDADAPLFGEGLGLDSIDALELGLAIKNKFGVLLASDTEETRRHFYSVASLARFVGGQTA